MSRRGLTSRCRATLPEAVPYRHLGPHVLADSSRAVAQALGGIASELGGATFLALIELAPNRWASITT